MDTRAAEALEARGLDVELVASLGVTGCERGYNWISIPYISQGQVINHKYRTVVGEKRFAQDAGRKATMYNIDCLREHDVSGREVIITEGEIDAWAAMQAGYELVLSVPDGAPAQTVDAVDARKYQFLDEVVPLLKPARSIILATDADGPGMALQHDLAVRLGKARCKWLRYPLRSRLGQERAKDLGEVLQWHGEAGIVRTIQKAEWCSIGGLYRMSKLPPSPEHEARQLGIAGLDDLAWMRPGDFWVVTGYPGDGKTSLLNEIAVQAVERLGWQVCIGSFEQRRHDIVRNLRTLRCGMLARDLTDADRAAADAWIEQSFVFLYMDEETDHDLSWLFDAMLAAVVQEGCKLIILDPWNELEHDLGDMTLTQYVGYALRQMRKFCARYGVTVILSAHPKATVRTREGKRPMPELGDISDSAHWWNRPDVGVIVYRDGNETVLHAQKIKYEGIIGHRGMARVRYDLATGRYRPILAPPPSYDRD